MPPLRGISPRQLLGRGSSHRYPPPQSPPIKGGEPPHPHFALYGTTPSYDHLRVFGYACYPNTSVSAPHKLSPRSTRCLFLGYAPDHKGYRYLDLTTHHVVIFRHVVFDEDVFPLAGSSPPTDLDSLLESDPSTHPPRHLAPCHRPLAQPHRPCLRLARPSRPSLRRTRGHADPACALSSPDDSGLLTVRDPYRRPRYRLPPPRECSSLCAHGPGPLDGRDPTRRPRRRPPSP
jgi:hypothetical protein